MSSLFTNRGVLVIAWFAVVALVAGVLALALLQPAPPPGAEPVVISLDLPQAPATEREASPPAEEAAGDEAPARDEPPEAAPGAEDGEASAGSGQAEVPQLPETAPEPSIEAAPQGPAEVPEEAPAQAAAPESQPDPVPDESPADPSPQQLALIPMIPPALEQLSHWERYRQPFNLDDKRPRIAVVLTGLGLSDSATEAAINQLPAAVTLSFSPYARDLEHWIALARARGHEVMLDLPMEPTSFPNEDPGPQALLTNLSPQANLDRLDWVLSRGSAYVGVAGSMGSRFTASRDAVEPILREVKERGLIFLDRRTTEDSLVPALAAEIGLPRAINNRSVDERQASRVAIDARLAQVERIALTDGFAVAMAQPYPVTLNRLVEWTAELTSRGFAIAPISALADRQKAP
ncbi:MAG: divergent polysaccharide deacetylase family protein [Kiloniellaceae bacterium]|nr:divergent polysaccharide deacetylase family protein [Kiloniellaceae bacterium]